MTRDPGLGQGNATVTFSILIGLVSTEDRERIFETLESLRDQVGSYRHEVILADRRNDSITEAIATRFPEVRLIACAPDASLPVLLTIGLENAIGEFVVVTEDHCVPARDWLESLGNAFQQAPEGTAAVGGCVENGVTDSSFDWATFLCEYSAVLAPVTEGPTSALAGVNVAYRRSALAALDRGMLTRGFWETTVHPELLHRGSTLYSSNKIIVRHCKKFSFRLFARQRFLYSRYFAGLRFDPRQYGSRACAFVFSFALPPIILCRISQRTWSKGRLRAELISAMPMLLVFVTIWSIGEMAGYLVGQGDALSRIE